MGISLRRLLVLAVVGFGLTATAVHAVPLDSGEGCMPFAKDWSFAIAVPEGWKGECSAEETHGVTVAVWPAGAQWPKAPGVMYATVTRRNGRTLDQVIADDQAEYQRHAPQGVVVAEPAIPLAQTKGSLRVVRTDAPDAGRHELIAYAELPKMVVLLVLSAESPAVLDADRDAFVGFARSFLPVDRAHAEDAMRPPASIALPTPTPPETPRP
jgi:hypothetical protein